MGFQNVVLFQDIHQISCLQSDRWHKSVATGATIYLPAQGSHSQCM